MTAWLPAVRLAGHRHWLPLSVPVGDSLAACLLSRDPQLTRHTMEACLTQDPPWFFLTLHHWQRSFADTALESTPIRLSQLASFAATHWPHWFQSGDAQLGAPSLSESLWDNWQKLYQQTLDQPRVTWPQLSTRWLELAGRPVTSRALELAVIVDDLEAVEPIAPGSYSVPNTYGKLQLNLSQLVRVVRHHQQLTNRFDDQLKLQKRAAVKQFAYGLSHELNNPLANIAVRAQGLMRAESDVSRKQSLGKIVDQTTRAHEMLADLMFFANPPQPVLAEVRIDELFEEVVQQYAAQSLELNIEIRKRARLSSPVQVDGDMLAEALSSLIRNSIEAIGVHGRIDISAKQMARGKQRVLQLKVADSGPGLSREAIQHAFDPYFSGREAGRGLGVGLCRAWRIAELHRGTLTLSAKPIGCTATMRLPIVYSP